MSKYSPYIIIAFAAALLFLPFLGAVHLFDWDEINFAECAREMIVSKDYLRTQIDFMPFWEKPPFFVWMQVLSMKIFGVGEYAARFPNAATGIVTFVTLYYAGKRIANRNVAMWWVLLYAASWLPHFYFKSGIIDPMFNFFIFVAFFQVYLVRFGETKVLHAVLAGLFLGLAVLTKGPVAILIALLALAVYIVVNKGLSGYKVRHLLLIVVCAFIPIALWLGSAVVAHGVTYGRWFIGEFISYQVRLFSTEDADHGGPFFYHFIILLIGCFPASIFLFQYTHKRITHTLHAHDFTRWMWILFWVVLILFSIVKTKIVHYSSLCYFPLTWLAALQLYRLSYEQLRLKTTVRWLLVVVGSLIAVLIIALPLVGINKQKLIPYINDPFAVGNLSAAVPWGYAECGWGLAYLAGVIISVVLMRKDFRRGMIALVATQVIIIQVTVLHFTPKIEAYSQRAAIDYCKSFAGKNVYVKPLGYMSYAYLFYADKQPSIDSNYYTWRTDKTGKRTEPIPNEAWLVSGNIDKPAFFLCKIQDKKNYLAMPQLEMTGEANGFIFFMRRKP